MKKCDAVRLFGGKVKDLADAMGVTSSAVSQWPEELPLRLADQVRGAALRLGRTTESAEHVERVTLGRTDDGSLIVAEAQ